MGFITGIGRCIVTLLNILFVIISLLLITLGIIAYKASDIELIADMEETIKTALKALATDTGSSNDGIQGFSISELLDGIGMAFIISGCLLLFLSFCGCCGACYKFRTLIFIYSLITGVLLITEIIVVILMYAVPSTIQGNIKNALLNSLKEYKGIGNPEINTLGWMFVMNEMKCCGVDGYTDFLTYAKNWDRTPGSVSPEIDAPLVCCKTAPTDTNATCARISTLDINEESCFDVVWNKMLGNPVYAGVGFGSCFTLQLLLVIFAVLLYIDMGKKDNGKVYPSS